MNAKARTKSDKVALVLLLVAVVELCGLITFIGVAWWQSQNMASLNPYDLTMQIQGHTWGTNNTYIVLSVKNTATKIMSVNEVVINDTVVGNVAYGGNFTGTSHTLEVGAVGTITITYPFSRGIEYMFQIGTHVGWRSMPYTAIAP